MHRIIQNNILKKPGTGIQNLGKKLTSNHVLSQSGLADDRLATFT